MNKLTRNNLKNKVFLYATYLYHKSIQRKWRGVCQARLGLKDSVRANSVRSTHFPQYNVVLYESHVHRAEFQKKWATRIMEYSFSTCLLMLLDCVYLSALQKYICHPQHIHFSVLKLCQHSTAAYKTVHLWEYTL